LALPKASGQKNSLGLGGLMVKKNFNIFLSAAVRNLQHFAEFVLKPRVCYVLGLEVVQAFILQ